MAFSGRSLATRGDVLEPSELLRNPVERETQGIDKVLAFMDSHCAKRGQRLTSIGHAPMKSDLESGGNFLCTPPMGDGFPFGAIIVGHDPARKIGDATLDFLIAQEKQPIVRIDTSWLQTGHTDEVLTFVPWPGSKHGFKALVANHDLAMKLMHAHRDKPMCVGVEDGFREKYQRMGDSLTRASASGVPSGPILDTEMGGISQAADEVRSKLDSVKTMLRDHLGLRAEDIIDIPVLYRRRTAKDSVSIGGLFGGGKERMAYEPFTPNSVNMLVASDSPDHATLVIPKPFGPSEGGGSCVFEKHIRHTLAASGNTLHFINDYQTNHVNGGNIHCSTTEMR